MFTNWSMNEIGWWRLIYSADDPWASKLFSLMYMPWLLTDDSYLINKTFFRQHLIE